MHTRPRPAAVHVFDCTRVGGIANSVLPGLVDAGVTVELVFLDEERRGDVGRAAARHARALGLSCHELLVRQRWDRTAIRALERVLTRLSPRIAHAHDVKASVYLAMAARRMRHPPALFSTHHGVHGRPDLKSALYERFYSHVVLRRFDRVLAVSHADRDTLVARGLHRDRVFAHRNGVDARLVEADDRAAVARQARAGWGIGDADGLVLGVVARLSREKCHDRVLAMAAELRRRMGTTGWRLLCFGEGHEKAALRALTRALGLEHHVRWMGFRPAVASEMAGLDLLISLSDAEGLPINLIEAGWAGTPVLSTAVGGASEVLGWPPAGVLVARDASATEVAAAVHGLLADASRRLELGIALQQRVRTLFSRAVWQSRLRALYAPWLEAAAEVA